MLAINVGLIHHFLRKISVQSQDYDGCFPFVPIDGILSSQAYNLSGLLDLNIYLGFRFFWYTFIGKFELLY